MIFGFFNSFLFGLILISLLDFIIFLILKINYFNAFGIDEYFNTIFVQNQNFYILLLATLPVGYLFIYSPIKKIIEKLFLVLVVISVFGFIPEIGMEFGKKIFMQEGKHFTLGKVEFDGDLLYVGKNNIYIRRHDIDKTIKIETKLLVMH